MEPRLLASAYDRSAAGYDERFRALQRVKFRAAAGLLEELPAGARCLDAGGGTGLFLEWAREEAPPLAQASWLVFDLSPGMLQQARAKGFTTCRGDLARPPLRAASFALIVAFTSLLEQVPRALLALSGLLAPGGQLVASFLQAEAPAPAAFRAASLRAGPAPLAAGQDLIFSLHKDAP